MITGIVHTAMTTVCEMPAEFTIAFQSKIVIVVVYDIFHYSLLSLLSLFPATYPAMIPTTPVIAIFNSPMTPESGGRFSMMATEKSAMTKKPRCRLIHRPTS